MVYVHVSLGHDVTVFSRRKTQTPLFLKQADEYEIVSFCCKTQISGLDNFLSVVIVFL